MAYAASSMTLRLKCWISIVGTGNTSLRSNDNGHYCNAQMCPARVRRSKFNQGVRTHKVTAGLNPLLGLTFHPEAFARSLSE
jgi:hypothetical protein